MTHASRADHPGRPGRDTLLAGIVLVVIGTGGELALRTVGNRAAPSASAQTVRPVPSDTLRKALQRGDRRLFGNRPVVASYLEIGKPGGVPFGTRSPVPTTPAVYAVLGSGSGPRVAVAENLAPNVGPPFAPQELGWAVLASSPGPVRPQGLRNLANPAKAEIRSWARSGHLPLGSVEVWTFPGVTLAFAGTPDHAQVDMLPSSRIGIDPSTLSPRNTVTPGIVGHK